MVYPDGNTIKASAGLCHYTVSSELQACTPCTLLRPKTDISVKQILQWLFRGSIAPRKGAGKKVNPALGQKICKFDWKSEILPISKQP